jgi:subtilisin family serine protease
MFGPFKFSTLLFSIALGYPLSTPAFRPNEYVVLLKETDASHTANLVGNLFQNDLFASAKLLHEYSYGFAAEMNEAAVEYVRSLPEVELVEENKIFTINAEQANPPSWGLPRVSQRLFNEPNVYRYPETAGAGVDVYVIDTGVYIQHKEFEGRASFGFSAVASEGNVDGNGHGIFLFYFNLRNSCFIHCCWKDFWCRKEG